MSVRALPPTSGSLDAPPLLLPVLLVPPLQCTDLAIYLSLEAVLFSFYLGYLGLPVAGNVYLF